MVLIRKDETTPITHRSTQVSLTLDDPRYRLLKRIGRSYNVTSKDFLTDILDAWILEHIEDFPEDERSEITSMINNTDKTNRRRP